jgi:hypothetical protein
MEPIEKYMSNTFSRSKVDDTSQYFIDHTVQGTIGAPYDIDDTIRLGAPYDIDATVISLVPKTVKIKY